MPSTDPIEHVIVLMLENRSFDHILGGLAAELHLDGVLPAGQAPRWNADPGGVRYEQAPGAGRTMRFDPHHELHHVFAQLAGGNEGLVDDFARAYPMSTRSDRAEIMKFHTDLPALHALARNFMVCDHWFSSVPGPTWTNRFFVHSGTSIGRVEMPNGILDANLHWYDQITLYDRLNERKKSWIIYYGDIPQSRILVNQHEPYNACQYKKMIRFYTDVAQHPEEPFPEYCFIEPNYYNPGANDHHPTRDVIAGDRLVANVYNAIRSNEQLWAKSLFIVLYDEHGGFFDHVVPPSTVAPDHHCEEYSFTQLGLRVPAVLASPWVSKGRVLDTEFDHTSLLRYLTDKWSLGPLGARTAQANTFSMAINSVARTDCPKLLPLSNEPDRGQLPTGRPQLSSHQTALFAMTQLLESMTDRESNALSAAHLRRMEPDQARSDSKMKVVIGHGGSTAWRDLKDFLKDRLNLPHDEFNRVAVAGIPNTIRLTQMLDTATIAFIVLTGEDEQIDGSVRARQNVIHEAGLFQGRLGFTKAIVMLEDGCEQFSNIEGLGQIRFPKGNIGAVFEEVRRVLEREAIIRS